MDAPTTKSRLKSHAYSYDMAHPHSKCKKSKVRFHERQNKIHRNFTNFISPDCVLLSSKASNLHGKLQHRHAGTKEQPHVRRLRKDRAQLVPENTIIFF